MTVVADTPTIVMSREVLRDAELVLDGVLPQGHLLGGPLEVQTDDPAHDALGGLNGLTVRLATDPVTVRAAREAGSLRLVDTEQTPLARLTELAPNTSALPSDHLTGILVRERRRESGEGRHLALDVLAAEGRYDAVVVLARPPLAGDEERLLDLLPAADIQCSLLLVVPDHELDTAHVPTGLMTGMAGRLADRLTARSGIRTSVATAPLAWRDPASDATLVGALALRLRTPHALLLGADARLDEAGAAGWQTVALALTAGEALDPALMDSEDVEAMLRWRPQRDRRGLVVMFTGLSGSGKSTLARALSQRIGQESHRNVTLLDGDVVRQMLSSGLGFDREARMLNVRRIGFVAAEIARHGGLAVCAPVAPYASMRAEVRDMVSRRGDFLLIHVNTPLEECERRDLKGLYARARQGLVPSFTGISDPYEEPLDADLTYDTNAVTTTDAVDDIIDHLRRGGWLGRQNT